MGESDVNRADGLRGLLVTGNAWSVEERTWLLDEVARLESRVDRINALVESKTSDGYLHYPSFALALQNIDTETPAIAEANAILLEENDNPKAVGGGGLCPKHGFRPSKKMCIRCLDDLRTQVTELEKERDRQNELICDECSDGSGVYYLNNHPQVCVCVGETQPYREAVERAERCEAVMEAADAFDKSPEKGRDGDWALRHQLHDALAALHELDAPHECFIAMNIEEAVFVTSGAEALAVLGKGEGDVVARNFSKFGYTKGGVWLIPHPDRKSVERTPDKTLTTAEANAILMAEDGAEPRPRCVRCGYSVDNPVGGSGRCVYCQKDDDQDDNA